MRRELCWGSGASAVFGAGAADGGGKKVAAAEVGQDLRARGTNREAGGGGRRSGGAKGKGIGGGLDGTVQFVVGIVVFVIVGDTVWWVRGGAAWCCGGLGGAAPRLATWCGHSGRRRRRRKRRTGADGKRELGGPG